MNVALVGLGHAARDLHLPALAALSEARTVGGFDLDGEARARVEEAWEVPTFPDFDALIEGSAPEVVVVGTPPDSHADYCIRALEAGCHVICEKPFVASLVEADRVIEAAERTGRRVALNHEFREMPIFRAVREAVGTPEVGELLFAQVWQLMDLPPWKEPGWRGRLLQRTLFEAGVHLVDLLVALFGEKPAAVSATVSSSGARDAASDAVALVTLEFSGGRLAHVVQNRICKGETQYFEVRAEGTEASLRASFGGRARLSAGLYRETRPHVRFEYGASGLAWREVGTRREWLARNPREPGRVATTELFRETLAAFREEREPPVGAGAGRDVIEVVAAAYRSAEQGRRVALDGTERELEKLVMGEAAG